MLDPAEFAQQMRAWRPEFEARFPGRLAMPDDCLPQVLGILFTLDSACRQRFMTDINGRPLFAVEELSQAIGVEAKWLAGLAIVWHLSLDVNCLQQLRPEAGAPTEDWMPFGGLVLTVFSIQPYQVRPLWDQQRVERLARLQALMRQLFQQTGLGPDDFEGLNALITPLAG